MKSLFIVLISYFLIAMSSCSNNDDVDNSSACSEPIPCTFVLISFHVSVNDANGSAVKLDSFEVYDTKNNKNLTIDYSAERLKLMQNTNSYFLFGDQWLKEYNGRTSIIRFRGFQNSKKIVSADFEVGTDCCHVTLLSGNTELIVN